MCDNCRIIECAFEGAASNPTGNYMPVYRMLAELLRQKRIRIYAGDCKFENVPEMLSSEKCWPFPSYGKMLFSVY